MSNPRIENNELCFVCECKERIEKYNCPIERAVVFAAVLGNVLDDELPFFVCDVHEPLFESAVAETVSEIEKDRRIR